VGDDVYEIFSGSRNKDPMWLESVEGLRAARERIKEKATATPGEFFVFCTKTYTVVASIDTSEGKAE